MTLQAQSLAFMTFMLLLLITIEGNSIPKEVNKDVTNVSSPLPQQPNATVNQVRPIGCMTRPWICSQGEFPPRSLCCGNRCVDVTADINNCGLCGVTCRFNWQCCNRLCVNTNVNLLNCGRCGNVCPFGQLCLFGLCSYTQPGIPVVPVTPVPPVTPAPPMLQPPILPPQQNAPQYPPQQSAPQPQPQPQPQQPESPSQSPTVE